MPVRSPHSKSCDQDAHRKPRALSLGSAEIDQSLPEESPTTVPEICAIMRLSFDPEDSRIASSSSSQATSPGPRPALLAYEALPTEVGRSRQSAISARHS